MDKKFYITTTLPYVNDIPHIGSTLEFVLADVIARYFRIKLGEEMVFFNLGTDEHGQKIYNKALSLEKDPQEYTDEYAQKWKDFCSLYNISYNFFYRTTDKEHKAKAQKFWQLMNKKGYIYKKKYEGLYCVGCESFKTEKDLVDGLCPDHKKAPTEYSEENYFLKLSEATDKLVDFLDKNPDFVKPQNMQKALVNFVKDGLQDISISRVRKNMPWGISVPGDQDQVMYVWFDALTNYIFTVGHNGDENNDNQEFNSYWPAVQICGPDNLRFQGAIWQGMLALAQISFTKKLLVHGMVLAEDGTKMSKSVGNVINPFDLAKQYPIEAVRFYLTVGCATYDDFAFSQGRLVSLYNDILADKFGNLINRVIHLSNKYEIDTSVKYKNKNDFTKKVEKDIAKFKELMEDFQLFDAYEIITNLCTYGNQYITEQEPWSKNKSDKDRKDVLQNLISLLWEVTDSFTPVIPESCTKAKQMLTNKETGILFTKL